jgi:hypothetical protein
LNFYEKKKKDNDCSAESIRKGRDPLEWVGFKQMENRVPQQQNW